MMSRIDRIRRAVSAPGAARSEAAVTDESFDASVSNLPVAVGPVTVHRSARSERLRNDSEFNAQLLGQDGERRGLRAGPTLFERARAAYNGIEWSGTFDRRARRGRGARTDI